MLIDIIISDHLLELQWLRSIIANAGVVSKLFSRSFDSTTINCLCCRFFFWPLSRRHPSAFSSFPSRSSCHRLRIIPAQVGISFFYPPFSGDSPRFIHHWHPRTRKKHHKNLLAGKENQPKLNQDGGWPLSSKCVISIGEKKLLEMRIASRITDKIYKKYQKKNILQYKHSDVLVMLQ